MALIEIVVDNHEANERLAYLNAKLLNLRPVMGAISEDMMMAVENNFTAEGRPEKWQRLTDATIRQKAELGYSNKILVRTGQLLDSIHPEYNATQAIVGTNLAYAAAHQFGVQTKPHIIRAKNKKSLAFWSGDKKIFRRSVNHPGSKIPARPFLMLTDADLETILTTINAFLE